MPGVTELSIKTELDVANATIEKLHEDKALMTEALLIVTGSWAEGGYLPGINSLGCKKIVELMEAAGVEPVFYTYKWKGSA